MQQKIYSQPKIKIKSATTTFIVAICYRFIYGLSKAGNENIWLQASLRNSCWQAEINNQKLNKGKYWIEVNKYWSV